MSKIYEQIDEELADWIGQQRIFFVATAPLSVEGHVNCSPKGGDSFRVLSPLEVAYLDYTGSGIETAAHLRENGRIVIMFCAFEGKPRIVRLHGQGTVLLPGDARFNELIGLFPSNPGTRAIVLITLSRVSTSCGYSLPVYDYRAERDTLDRWAIAQGETGLTEYRAAKNCFSIDALPALTPTED